MSSSKRLLVVTILLLGSLLLTNPLASTAMAQWLPLIGVGGGSGGPSALLTATGGNLLTATGGNLLTR